MLIASASCEQSLQTGGQQSQEVAALKDQLKELVRQEAEVQDEMQKALVEYNKLRNVSALRTAVGTMEQKREAMLREVTPLRERKAQLEREIETLTKKTSAYRQKYL